MKYQDEGRKKMKLIDAEEHTITNVNLIEAHDMMIVMRIATGVNVVQSIGAIEVDIKVQNEMLLIVRIFTNGP